VDKENRTINLIALHTGKAVIITAIYFVVSLIGGLFTLDGKTTPIIWPQTGFALVAILLLGNTTLPEIFIGSLIVAFTSGVPFLFAIINAFGNVLGVFISAYFISQQKGFSNLLNNYRSVFYLMFFGVILGPIVSASINIAGMYLLQLNPIELLPSIWSAHWVRNAFGILIFTPVLLVWLGNPFPGFKMEHAIENLVIFFSIIGLEFLLFFGEIPTEVVYLILFLVIPLIIWSSIRNKIHGSSLINFTTAVVFLWAIANKQGALFNNNSPPHMTYIGIMSIMLITSLIISALIAKLNITQKSLTYLSTHDTLTGLYNRMFFEAESKRLEKSRQFPISIVMADFDKLKNINDSFGHRTGDQVLINIANLFSEIFRKEDIVSRHGGDEFVILLPRTDAPIVNKIVQRIKKQISVYNKKHMDLPINISMGVSTAKQGESLSVHLKNADKLMYQEKQKKQGK